MVIVWVIGYGIVVKKAIIDSNKAKKSYGTQKTCQFCAQIAAFFHAIKVFNNTLNEFTFRFNRRRTPMAVFQTILGLASKVEDWPTYEELYSGECEHQMVKGRYRLYA